MFIRYMDPQPGITTTTHTTHLLPMLSALITDIACTIDHSVEAPGLRISNTAQVYYPRTRIHDENLSVPRLIIDIECKLTI